METNQIRKQTKKDRLDNENESSLKKSVRGIVNLLFMVHIQ